MTFKLMSVKAAVLSASIAINACGKPDSQSGDTMRLAPPGWGNDGGTLIDRQGREIGRVIVRQADGGVFVRIRATKLTPGWHGVHFHMTADCSDREAGFQRSGAKFDPDGRDQAPPHAGRDTRGRLPNIFADRDGFAQVEFFRSGVMLAPSDAGAAASGSFPLLDDDGFALIIHADPDDHVTEPIGGTGERIACAAISK